jgi:GTPase SAR1 family protein
LIFSLVFPFQKVSKHKGQALADHYQIKFFETSAKSNTNVEEVFMSVANDAFKLYKREEMPTPTLRASASTSKKSCCN